MPQTAEQRRQYRKANRDKIVIYKFQVAHGPYIFTDWSVMWERQAGCCYLCGRVLIKNRRDPHSAYVDHDHSCCSQGRSCVNCRRGLACNRCNLLIGFVNDDVNLLIKIAENLKAAQSRLKISTQQDRLFDAETA